MRNLAVFILMTSVSLAAASPSIAHTHTEQAATAAYTPTFTAAECPYIVPFSITATCGYMTVPENRSKPSDRTIKVFAAVLHSLNPNPEPDPVVALPGGPGYNSTNSRTLFYPLTIRQNRDIILIDPRGTGFSQPSLDCRESDRIGRYYANAEDAASDCRIRLTKDGVDIASYGGVEQAADVADLAKALKLKQINLHGSSCGTRVAIQIALRYPELVRSLTLDGVFPIDVNAGLQEPIVVNDAFRRVFADCAADAACDKANPNLKARYLNLLGRFDKGNIPAGLPFVDAYSLALFLFQRMYDSCDEIPAFITALHVGQTEQACDLYSNIGLCYPPQAPITPTSVGTPTPIKPWQEYITDPQNPYGPNAEQVTWLMKKLNFKTPQALVAHLNTLTHEQFLKVWDTLPAYVPPNPVSEPVYYSTWCSEEASFYTLDDIKRVATRIPSTIAAFPVDRASLYKRLCDVWNVPPVPASYKVTPVLMAPTLILNGTHDPITPPMYAQQVATYKWLLICLTQP